MNATKPKYAVFIDDSFDSVFPDKESAKKYAAESRVRLRSAFRKVSCFVKRLTIEEAEMFGY